MKQTMQQSSRAMAAKVVSHVVYDGKSLTEALLTIPDSYPQNDKGFIKQICFGTLRWWFQLKTILATKYLRKPLNEMDTEVLVILCVGLYQVLYLSQPAYAVVNEMVNSAKNINKSWACGLINKILKLASQDKEAILELCATDEQLKYAHPSWLTKKIKKAWPQQYQQILAANNQQAPLSLRVNLSVISRENYVKLLEDAEIAHNISTDTVTGIQLTHAMPVDKIPGFFDGLVSVQDYCGQKAVEYLDLHSEQHVLDACAAPGSKFCHILEAQPDISSCVGVDISADRLEKIDDNLSRLNLSTEKVRLFTADITVIDSWWDGQYFDRILVDAPCSATGVIRRHPDIKIHRKGSDINQLSEVQLSILQCLWPLLAPNGKLLYSTCSILPSENEAVIDQFLSTIDDGYSVDIHNSWGETRQFGQQVITGTENRDGFYYALLQKSSPAPKK